jgi:hypothetical protein
VGNGVRGSPCCGKEWGGSGHDMRGVPRPAAARGRQAARPGHAGSASMPGQGKRVLTRGSSWHSVGWRQWFKLFQTDFK